MILNGTLINMTVVAILILLLLLFFILQLTIGVVVVVLLVIVTLVLSPIAASASSIVTVQNGRRQYGHGLVTERDAFLFAVFDDDDVACVVVDIDDTVDAWGVNTAFAAAMDGNLDRDDDADDVTVVDSRGRNKDGRGDGNNDDMNCCFC